MVPSGLTTLKKLVLVETKVRQQDLDFLFKADTAYIPELEELILADEKLTVPDIKSLFQAIHQGKLPHLKKLVLGYIVLTGSFGNLVGDFDHSGFHRLKELCLERTELMKKTS